MGSGEELRFLSSFMERSGSRTATILCGDVSRGLCDRMAALARGLGVNVRVYEVARAEQRRVLERALRLARSCPLARLVVPLLALQPLLWLALRLVRTRVGEEVLRSIDESDSVVWVGLHEDFDVTLLVDERVLKAIRGKHALLLSYPSRETAERLGVPYEDYLDSFLRACDTPWEEMREVAERLRGQLLSGGLVRVRTPHGTDLAVRYDPARCLLWSFYGVASERALREGRLVLQLPAGEVGIGSPRAPLEAEGRAFFDVPRVLRGRVVSGVDVTIRSGRVVSYDAERGRDALEEYFGCGGSRRVHELGFGLNPAIIPRGSVHLDEKAYKTVHVGFGRLATPLHEDFVMSDPRVYVDGREITW